MHPCPSCQATLQTPPHDFKADAVCDRCGGVWMSSATIKSTLQSWRIKAQFVEIGPSADFCPSCGPVPLDEGTLLGQEGLRCSSCRGVFMRKALKYERSPHPSVSTQPPRQANTIERARPSLPQAIREQSKPPQVEVNPITQPEQFKKAPQKKEPAQPIKSPQAKTQLRSQKPPQPKRQIKAKAHISHKSNHLKSQSKTELDFNKSDAAWIALLLIGISISLVYWMNP
ncbi:MAG: hypothetical protein CMH49_10220 [Myxococcales bacterium]|nr:hypothetical protein [Myxococcales bacterium]